MLCFGADRILLFCCGILQIHTKTMSKKDALCRKKKPKTKQKLIVSVCICSNGTAVLANPAGHNHQKALVSLPDHNNSNRVEDCSLTFILELHCGTRERSLCCVLCVYVRLTGAEPPHRLSAGTDLTQSGASPGPNHPREPLHWFIGKLRPPVVRI